jgi:aerobic-type carbon monoxide dehydrogenase small subunit (CoxS/CutS family)
MATYTIKVNGNDLTVNVAPNTPLLWVLRDSLDLTGTKFCCGIGMCHACTVHVDGEAKASCLFQVSQVGGQAITTIEGLSENRSHPLQEAWIAEEVPQCGYCQSGQIMAAAALLARKPRPTDEDIDEFMSANICRCGTYPRIRRAIHRVAAGVSHG